MKVGIQGLQGSFHHQAALDFFNSDIEIAPFESFNQVFEALEMGLVDRAIVAIENSLYGSINDTYDLLMQYKPSIVGEVYLHISLNLWASDNSTIKQITDVYSQAPALAEAKQFLRQNLAGATLRDYTDTAMSARFVAKQNNPKFACVASQMAGQLYHLKALSEGIEDHKHNYTRFMIIAKDENKVIDADKTSIVIQTNHQAGDLYTALGAFANNGINLSKIESRPIVSNHGWHYIFYLDFETSITDERAKKAIEKLTSNNTQITNFGSYKKGELPKGL